jgi:hypothetical protein
LQFANEFIQGVQATVYLAVGSDFTVYPTTGYSNINTFFVDIQANIQYFLSHGLPPWFWLWLWAVLTSIGRTAQPTLQGADLRFPSNIMSIYLHFRVG